VSVLILAEGRAVPVHVIPSAETKEPDQYNLQVKVGTIVHLSGIRETASSMLLVMKLAEAV